MAVELDYPEDLPCVSRIDGYAMQASAAAIRTPFGVGASHQRRTHLQMPMQMQIAWRVNNEQLHPLFTWLNENGYDWFNVDLSGVESSKMLQFKSPMAIRLITDINIALLRIHRQNWYIVSTSAEYYPPLTSRAYEVPLFLVVQEATHAHTADSLTVAIPSVTLAIQDALHAHTSDAPSVLPSVLDLTIADALHSHTTDAVMLSVLDLELAVDNTLHDHAADNLTLTPVP